jgi:cyclopropane fatty-acyl-phospholipid synthase-like methyltransferase
MSLRSKIVSQFKRPRGFPGQMAGLIMANRSSNRARNLWTVDLADLQPDHHVLEIGCGPGIALEAGAARSVSGKFVGLDHSDVMIRQARKRLHAEIAKGQIELRCGGLQLLDEYPARFDRVLSLNVVQFFADMDDAFTSIASCLIQGGMVFTTYMPRHKNPTRQSAFTMASAIRDAMTKTGFSNIEIHELPLAPVAAICVAGKRV